MNNKKVNLYFEIIKEIGQEGLNSNAFLCKDKQLEAEIVVKQIPRNNIINTLDDYHKEARILYNHKHPNICEIQWGAECSENIYLAMPYYKNGSLNSILDKRILTVKEIIKYSLDILNGLQFIHSKKLLHLDIKPTNILINNSNRALLTDFGLSKMLQNEKDAVIVDCFYYTHVAPEVLSQYPLGDIKYDIYQFGITLYRMCNGNKHFHDQYPKDPSSLKTKILNNEFPDKNSFRLSINKKLKDIVRKCLHIDRNKRYSSVIEIMNDLSKIDTGLNWELKNNKLIFNDEKHIIEIELYEKENKFFTIGKKINKDTLKEICISKYKGEFNSENERTVFIENILNDF